MYSVDSRLSIATYSFHGMLDDGVMDVFGYLESLAFRYGLTGADIWNGFIKDMDADQLKKVRRAMDERGLYLANLCCDHCHPWDADKDKLAEQNAYAEKMLEAAEILGARTVRFDLGVRERDITQEQFDYVASRFAQYCKRAENGGYRVGIENHWGASRRIQTVQRLYKELNTPAFGLLLHLGNWDLDEGQTAEENNILAAPMAMHTHVTYPWALRADTVIPELIRAGYTNGTFSIEHQTGTNEYEYVASALALVRLALAKM